MEFLNHIGGKWVDAQFGERVDRINPAITEQVVGTVPVSGAEDVEAALAAAQQARSAWRAKSITARANCLDRAAALLDERAETIAKELTAEEGKPFKSALGEVQRAARTFRFYAVAAQTYVGATYFQDDAAQEVYTQLEPLGVVAVISPWNFPISIPSRKIAPALMAGNTVVFKPSSDAPLSGYRLTESLVDAGIPAGVLNLVIGPASRTGAVLTGSPWVRAVTFTGSTAAGHQITKDVNFNTRLQMELGGKNPLIVMDDADLGLAVDLTVRGGFELTGQACTGTSRVLVHSKVKRQFLDALVAAASKLKVGDGMTTGVDIGPLANKKQHETVNRYVEIGKSEARCVLDGTAQLSPELRSKGYFVGPTIFDGVDNSMTIAREEIFGPVLSIIDVSSYEEAIAIANDTPYGLSASLVTRDSRLMHRFPHDIEAGTVKINRTTTGNLINAPFGGIKDSSIGSIRESGRDAMEFFLQKKTVYRGI